MSSITVVWDNPEQTVVRIDFKRGWTWPAFDFALDDAARLVESVANEVDVIFNLRRGPQMPVDYVFSHLRHMLRQLPDNTGCLVVVDGDTTTRALMSVFYRPIVGAGPAIVFLSSLEEARAWITWRQVHDQA
jgi:deoxyribose-phosphate aldolase